MLALYRCGRQADALAANRRLRRVLGGELGVEPVGGVAYERRLAEVEVAWNGVERLWKGGSGMWEGDVRQDVTSAVVSIRLLGTVAVAVDDGWLAVAGRRRSAVLAALALQPGDVVSADSLVDVVWGDRAPRTASGTLRNHLSYLRRVLPEGATVVARSAGYALELDGGGVDARTAEDLIGQAAGSLDVRQREACLRTAIAMWQGPPLSDLTGLVWFDGHAQRLQRLLLQARRLLIAARLELGGHQHLVSELEELSREHPFDEQFHGQLMTALYRCGRQADALAVYHRLRVTLDEQLGVLPDIALRDLATAVLRQDPALAVPPAPEAVAVTITPALTAVPAQLPATVAAFVGRERERAVLDGILARSGTDVGPVLVVVSGTAGVGKTTLAVRWAHQVQGRFPDGQLYVNLRGYDPTGPVMDPAEAVRGFLAAFGVSGAQVPSSAQAQIGLYRSVLSGKRLLILADNAHDEQQVRSLLPGGPGSLVVLTSRNQLPGLLATHSAHALPLERPSESEARQILAQRLGSRRVDAEPQAVHDIITACARLPLALAIAATQAVLAPQLPMAALAAQLRDTATSLDPFDGADPETNIRAVFSWSYRTLSAPAARLFRLLGLCAGSDIALPAAASLSGLPAPDVRPLLAELTRAHLLTETSPDRFGLHDLLRAYAIEQAHQHDSDEQQAAARHRFLDHHLYTAHAATLLLKPARDPIDLAAPAPGVTPQPLADLDAALAWFKAEHSVLLATMARPPDSFDRHTWQLAWTLVSYLTTQGYWHDHELAQQAGLRAADRLGDRSGQAYTHRSLGKLYTTLGRLAEAQHHTEVSLRLFEQVGNLAALAASQLSVSAIAERHGDLHKALQHAEHAHRLYQSLGHSPGQAYAANNIGWFHGRLGTYADGLRYCREALDTFNKLEDVHGAAATWDTLGVLHFGMQDPQEGERCYQQAITHYRKVGDRLGEADTYANLVDGHIQTGNHDAAHHARRQAIAILDDLEPDAAAHIRARLAATAAP
jgi:DNA-binding SARP family transcriptional activator/tetratricopeptide (TPR) repeat protein